VIEVVETEEKIQACTRHHVPPGIDAGGTDRGLADRANVMS
jgi:hypothetical protein